MRDLVVAGLTGPTYRIGPLTPLEVSDELKKQNADPAILRRIQKDDWPRFIKEHDGTTLEAAVRFILTEALSAIS